MSAGRTANQILPRPATWSEAARPEWLALAEDDRRLTIGDIVDGVPPQPPAEVTSQWADAVVEPLEGFAPRRSAAVACIVHELAGRPAVLITRRPWSMRSHSGELSFPGGGREPDEPLVDTAIRETAEEVGIAARHLEILGALRPLRTFSTRRLVMPYVAVWNGRGRLRPNPAEVDEILHVPLDDLLADGAGWRENWQFPSFDFDVSFFSLGMDVIWGATAAMLTDLFLRTLHVRLVALDLPTGGVDDPMVIEPPRLG